LSGELTLFAHTIMAAAQTKELTDWLITSEYEQIIDVA
jgi:hypothetical protein